MAVEHLQKSDRSEHDTYQYLRGGMIVSLVALGLSLLFEIKQSGWCVQKSISAYYFTEVQALFVGTLLSLGLAMVVISGRLVVEDVALNLAGLLAPIVAFAPTKQLDYCGLCPEQRETAKAVVADAFSDGSVANNMVAYLLVVAVVLIIGVWLLQRAEPKPRAIYWAAWWAALAWWALVAGAFRWLETFFNANAHLIAAVAMFVFIFIAVCANAFDLAATGPGRRREKGPRSWARAVADAVRLLWLYLRDWRRAVRNRYGVIAAAMAGGVILISIWCAVTKEATWFFWIEVWLLAMFLWFWGMQTSERARHRHNDDSKDGPSSPESEAGATATTGD